MTLSNQSATAGIFAIATAARPGVTWREKIGATAVQVSMPLVVTGYDCKGTLGAAGNALTLDVQAGSGSVSGSGTAATGTLTLTGNAVANETVTIGAKTYTWKASVSTTANEVKIGATASDSLDNLIAAVNAGAGSGTVYGSATTANAAVTAAAGTGDTMDLTAVAVGTSYNSTATTETMTNGSFGAATLTGGVNASTLVGADGKDFEGTTLTALTKVMGIEVRCTAGSLHIGSSGNITTFNTASGGVFHWHDPAGSNELIAPDLVITAITADTSFEVSILGTTV